MTGDTLRERIDALRTRPTNAPPLVMLTAYDFVSAQIVDAAGVDLVLVGDSAATTVLGYAYTREIQEDELLMLTRAARRGVQNALLVGDLPYGSYEGSDSEAVAAAGRFAGAGCDLVKLEGAGPMALRARAIVAEGIPVIGHVGLLPQAAQSEADLRARGRTAADAIGVVRDAMALQRAGCTALVVEAVPSVVGAAIASHVSIPLIGIGAGAGVDGQVLVLHDMLGLAPARLPRFVRQYGALREAATLAVQQFAADVRSRAFPAAAEEYGMPDNERRLFEAQLSGIESMDG